MKIPSDNELLLENQNLKRELEIEAALEAVRSRTMSMQTSKELKDVVLTLYKQLDSHEMADWGCAIMIFDKDANRIENWVGESTNSDLNRYYIEGQEHSVYKKLWENWEKQTPIFTLHHTDEVKREFDNFWLNQTDYKTLPDEVKASVLNEREVFLTYAFMKHGCLSISGYKKLTVKETSILERFARVFEQTYTRFLDLQKAEGQAREAEIELALERVRARTMAMLKSEELAEVVFELFTQMYSLGFAEWGAAIALADETNHGFDVWFSTPYNPVSPERYFYPNHGHEVAKTLWTVYENQTDLQIIELEYEEKTLYTQWLFENTSLGGMSEDDKTEILSQPYVMFSSGAMKYGLLEAISHVPMSPELTKILPRFAKVFEQVYSRFLDLQKAEGQAREAKIEAGLERVRAASMAMHKSEELKEVASAVFRQLKELNIEMDTASILILSEHNADLNIWIGMESDKDYSTTSIHVPEFDDYLFSEGNSEIKNRKPLITKSYTYEEKNKLWNYLFEYSDFKIIPDERKKFILDAESYTISVALLKNTGIQLIRYSSSLPFSEKENETLQRFCKVFEQAYTRFLDLQKAEEQSREAEIELALEKVRARTMAMHDSADLRVVVSMVFEELTQLGFAMDGGIILVTFNDQSEEANAWISDHEQTYPVCFKIQYSSHTVVKDLWDAHNASEDFFFKVYSKKEKNNWFKYAFEKTDLKFQPLERKEWILSQESLTQYVANAKDSMFVIHSHSNQTLTENEIGILKRFSKVFEQTYTRFLDLQKAEAHAREAQIEAALERVRSRTMAMHHSDELSETAKAVFEQFYTLGNVPDRISIGIFNEEENLAEVYVTNQSGDRLNMAFEASLDEPTTISKLYQAWKRKESTHVVHLFGGELRMWVKYCREKLGLIMDLEKIKDDRFHNAAFFSKGLLLLTTSQQIDKATLQLLSRFSHVFDQTYTRFLDLQKSEAQAREAQIEASLERVRSRSMGMRKSEELADLSMELVKQVQSFGLDSWFCAFNIYDNDPKGSIEWGSNGQGTFPQYRTPREGVFLKYYEAGQSGQEFLVNPIRENECAAHYEYLCSLPVVGETLLEMKENGIPFPKSQIDHVAFFKYGYVLFITYEPAPDAHDIFKRFAKVFEQTYTRFLDLQKAEIQAREAELELALERVRARTMAMQKSDELSEVAALLFRQLKILGADLWTAVIAFCKEDELLVEKWGGSPITDQIFDPLFIPYNADHGEQSMYDTWKNKVDLYSYVQEGKELKDIYDHLMTIPSFKASFQKVIDAGRPLPVWQKNHVASYKYGYLLIVTENEFEEEYVFTRFAKVFEQTYTRFLDLQKAEQQAKEAIKQDSLDRVRGEIASMRSTEDLDRITPLIWNELTTLGVPFIRCGVFIVNEAIENVEVFLSTPDGKPLGMLNLSFDSNELTSNSINAWKKSQVYQQHWNKTEFVNWTSSLLEHGQIGNSQEYQGTIEPPEKLDLHFIPFKQGMLYVGSTEALDEETIDMVQSLANAFSIAYARYEDFNELDKAKQSIEITLSELKSTQKQLIQSEKMASLGELTAGIAHEIQNPLNFVNNFSEVTEELVEELEEESALRQAQGTNNSELEKELINDIKENLKKINHHGNRASSILKGMLEHSRTSSGKRELKDINSLADEYLRLSYHGLRAKDKGFNAEMVVNFDADLPKVEVIPTDIGRVLLNLINNAFQACIERSSDTNTELVEVPLSTSENADRYKPTVTITTSQEQITNGQKLIAISIKDNGPGIPDAIKDKIFQPFFTTKPTCKGTGLGLSLAYDIVKAHGGELTVQSIIGIGSSFTIKIPLKSI
jgi:signal transduction histidine kinase